MTFENLIKFFNSVLHIEQLNIPVVYKNEYERICKLLGTPKVTNENMESSILQIVVNKLGIKKDSIKFFIDKCAEQKVYFNYHEKNNIAKYIESNDIVELTNLLNSKGIRNPVLMSQIELQIIDKQDLLKLFANEMASDKKRDDVYTSIFSAFIFSLFPKEEICSLEHDEERYSIDFYTFLKQQFPSKYERGYALSFLRINNEMVSNHSSYDELINSLSAFVSKEYQNLQNYCYFSVLIESDIPQDIMWKLYSDLVLYSEKFISENLETGYFHPEKIKEASSSYIDYEDIEDCHFEKAETGFTYKDCYVISEQSQISNKENNEPYKILLLFQKNKRDEDVIPCPACRSKNVRGNSYPILGVKSWECHNPLCFDKSKYNRGKRYSMSSIIKQEAISNPLNQIEKDILTKWHLDVVSRSSTIDILSFLVKEYSLVGDTIYIYNLDIGKSSLFLREIKNGSYKIESQADNFQIFEQSSYFKRFEISNSKVSTTHFDNLSDIDGIKIYNGDCFEVLQHIKDCSLNGAVTSPPYYNAKEYSYWNNIYCYLYDMYNHAKEVYRTLQPGAYFVYNIFDYFDNENNVAFSDMGKKRMILGAYIIHMFRKIGFEIQQNIIWYKGEIQGHRSTNQGNFSPYYQAPLNCYEHVFCFRKPGDTNKILFPTILKATPVIKMVKGVNTLGHTAPYPLDIPNLLFSRIKSGTVLDPYSGSFTSARSARFYELDSINIEYSKDYCDLGLRLLKQQLFL